MPAQVIPADRRPIGFWHKLLDRLIDEQFATTLDTHQLSLRHWVTLNDERASLAPEGSEAFERLRCAVSQNRAALMAGIASEDYAATIAVLQRMARNLGWSEPAQTAPL